MNSGATILLICLGIIVLVTVLTVVTMRLLARKFKVTDLMDGGVRMTQDGIEYLGLHFTGTRRKTFSEIRSVELVPFYKALVLAASFRNGISVGWIPPNFFGEIIVIKLKRPNPIEYLFFTPTDRTNFVEQLKQRISEA